MSVTSIPPSNSRINEILSTAVNLPQTCNQTLDPLNTECGNQSNSILSEDLYDYNIVPYPDLTQLQSVRIIFLILYGIIMILGLFGNLVICYTVISNRKMQTVVNCYIFNLATCDFLVGAFVLPVKLLELMAPANWYALNDGLCTAMLFLQTLIVFASELTLVATCFER